MSAPVLKYTMVVRHPETDAATALVAGKPVPEWAEDLVQEDDLTTGDGGEVEGYDDLKVDALKVEIDRRNEGRTEDAQLSKEGKKADLVAVLVADDAAQA